MMPAPPEPVDYMQERVIVQRKSEMLLTGAMLDAGQVKISRQPLPHIYTVSQGQCDIQGSPLK
jgi:hypothetical protein